MSLTYKFNTETEKEKEDPQDIALPEESKDIENYPTPGNTRNVCFVDAEGKETFLNYAYLVKGTYTPEKSEITLSFTSDAVTLKGNNLANLFNEFVMHTPRKIVVIDKRYEGTKNEDQSYVTEITMNEQN